MTRESASVETIDLTFLGSGNHRTTHKNILNMGFQKLEKKLYEKELRDLESSHLDEESKFAMALQNLKQTQYQKLALPNIKKSQKQNIIRKYKKSIKKLISKKEFSDKKYTESLKKLVEKKPIRTAMRLFDGIGCKGTEEHPRPGTYTWDPETGRKQKNPEEAWLMYFDLKNIFKKLNIYAQSLEWNAWNSLQFLQECLEKFSYSATKQLISSKDSLGDISAFVSGAGMKALVDEADVFIQDIIKKNNGIIPKTINLKGHSRGADACIRLANKIYELYPQIEINMFLLDPVPGPYHRKDDGSYIIPANVKLLNVNYMLDESIPFLKPQHRGRLIIANPALTKVEDHYLRGGHSDASRIDANPKRYSEQTKKTFLELQENFQNFIKTTSQQEVVLPVSFGVKTPKTKIWTSPVLFDIDVLNPQSRHQRHELSSIYFSKNKHDMNDEHYHLYILDETGPRRLNFKFKLSSEMKDNANQCQITFDDGIEYNFSIIPQKEESFQLSPAAHPELFEKMTDSLSEDELKTLQSINREKIRPQEEQQKSIVSSLYTRTLTREDHKTLYQKSNQKVNSYLSIFFQNKQYLQESKTNPANIESEVKENIKDLKQAVMSCAKADFYKEQFRDAIHFYHYHEPHKIWTKTISETISDAYQRLKEILQGKTMEEKTKFYPNQYAFMKIKEALDFETNLKKEEAALKRTISHKEFNQKLIQNRNTIVQNYEKTFQLINQSLQNSFFKTHLKEFSEYQTQYVSDVLRVESAYADAKRLDELSVAADTSDNSPTFSDEKEMVQLKKYFDAQKQLPLLRKEILENKTLSPEKQKELLQQIDAIGQAVYVTQVLKPIKQRDWGIISIFSSPKSEPPIPAPPNPLGPDM